MTGCLPLLIQILHGNDKDSPLGDTRGSKEARARAAAALHNIVHSHPDDKKGRREARVLRLLEQIRAHCDMLRDVDSSSDEEITTSPGTYYGHGFILQMLGREVGRETKRKIDRKLGKMEEAERVLSLEGFILYYFLL